MCAATQWDFWKEYVKSQDYDSVTLILLLFKFHSLLLTSFCFKDEKHYLQYLHIHHGFLLTLFQFVFITIVLDF